MNRREFVGLSLLAGGALIMRSVGMSSAQPPAGGAPNILFIPVDDLRPQLRCFGHEQMISPNIDRLAAEGTAFVRTHCQQAVCAPSRASLLSGLRPDSTRVWDLETPLATTRPEIVTLPRHLRAHGYTTVSLGKVYHHRIADDPEGWSEPPWGGQFTTHGSEELRRARIEANRADREAGRELTWRGPSTEALDVPDAHFGDGLLTERALEDLRRLAGAPEPFFLAVGYHRPHLPFACPQRYWEMYPPESIDLADNPFRPQDCPDIALTNWGELRQYTDIPKEGDLPEDKARELIRGYYACTTFIDAQVGRLLDGLEALGLRENTHRLPVGRPRLAARGARPVVQAHQLRDLDALAAGHQRARSGRRRAAHRRALRVRGRLPHAVRARRPAPARAPRGHEPGAAHGRPDAAVEVRGVQPVPALARRDGLLDAHRPLSLHGMAGRARRR